MHEDFSSEPWFSILDLDLQRMVVQSYRLLEQHELAVEQYEDYSFIVFLMSKAYEGFLKYFLLKTGLINEATFNDRKFRIGRALNPDVSSRQKNEYWLYDDVEHYCSEEVARQLWDTWLECRNRVFHYFPGQRQTLTLIEAKEYLMRIRTTMYEAVTCQVSLGKD